MRPFAFYLHPTECKNRLIKVTDLTQKNITAGGWYLYLISVEDHSITGDGTVITEDGGVEFRYIPQKKEPMENRCSYVFPFKMIAFNGDRTMMFPIERKDIIHHLYKFIKYLEQDERFIHDGTFNERMKLMKQMIKRDLNRWLDTEELLL